MTARPGTGAAAPDGLLGLYALSEMARAGPVHGYLISERIASGTEGAWRPGPGAVYPALVKLTRRGLAKSHVQGRRRLYTITPRGREVLARVRDRQTAWNSHGPDLSGLWAQISGIDDPGAFLLLRLRRVLDQVDVALESLRSSRPRTPGLRSLREDVVGELGSRLERLRRVALPGAHSRARGRAA